MDKFIKIGQKWNLSKSVDRELRKGVYIIKDIYADSILLGREDNKRFWPQGAAAIYRVDIFENKNFNLI